MLKRILAGAAFAAVPLLLPAVAHAQSAPVNGVLEIFGNDKCPTNENGEEIVVCVRKDESERFRIPSNLRAPAGPPQQTESWAVRSQDALTSGNVGTGSCTTVGAGGSTGCFVKQATKAKAEAKARGKATRDLPLP